MILEADFHARQDDHVFILRGSFLCGAIAPEKRLARLARVPFARREMVGDYDRAVAFFVQTFNKPRGRKPAAAAYFAGMTMGFQKNSTHLKQSFSTLL